MISFFAEHSYILYTFLITMGFLSGVVNAATGGGSLISIPALTMTGMPIAMALGTNKLQTTIGFISATHKYYKSGLINLRTVFRGLVMGFIGAIFGTIVAVFVDSEFMNYILPPMLIAIFLFNLLNRKIGIEKGRKRMNEALFFSIFGFILGAYDGFFGACVGSFWVIAIVFFLGYTYLDASGYARILNLKSNLFSLIAFMYFGYVNFFLGFIMAIGNFIGGYVGAILVVKFGSGFVRPFFIIVVGGNIIALLCGMHIG